VFYNIVNEQSVVEDLPEVFKNFYRGVLNPIDYGNLQEKHHADLVQVIYFNSFTRFFRIGVLFFLNLNVIKPWRYKCILLH